MDKGFCYLPVTVFVAIITVNYMFLTNIVVLYAIYQFFKRPFEQRPILPSVI